MKYGEWLINIDNKAAPKEIVVETTTKCNLNCIYCFRRNILSESYGSMDVNLYKKIIRNAQKISINKIVFSGWGEPLIHPHIIDFIEYAKKNRLKVLLNTNGHLLEEYVKDIYNLGVDELVVSVDSIDESIFKKLRVGGDINKILDSLYTLTKYKKKYGSKNPIIAIQYTITKLNYINLPKLLNVCHEIGCNKVIISNIIPLNYEYEAKYSCYNDPICIDYIKNIKGDIAKRMLKYNINVIFPNITLKTERYCPFIHNYAMYIRWDGKTAPCIYYSHKWEAVIYGVKRKIYPIIFGDLNDEDILNIWKNKIYVRFRLTVYFMYMPSCLDCELQSYCVLTRSNEFDCWGNTPTCSHCPYSRELVYCPL